MKRGHDGRAIDIIMRVAARKIVGQLCQRSQKRADRSRSSFTPMLPDGMSGKMSVLAGPATIDPGTLEGPTASINAAATCKLAIDPQIRCSFANDPQRLHHPIHALMLRASFGKKREQRDYRLGPSRLSPDNAACNGPGRNCDFGPFHHRWIDHNSAVGILMRRRSKHSRAYFRASCSGAALLLFSKIGVTRRWRAKRSAADRTRGSWPSGNTMRHLGFTWRRRSICAARNAAVDSGSAIKAS